MLSQRAKEILRAGFLSFETVTYIRRFVRLVKSGGARNPGALPACLPAMLLARLTLYGRLLAFAGRGVTLSLSLFLWLCHRVQLGPPSELVTVEPEIINPQPGA